MASASNEPKAIVKKQPKKNAEQIDHKIYRLIAEIDRPLLIIILALVSIGSIMVFSASYSVADSLYDDSYFFARKQIRWVIIGIIFMFLMSRLNVGVLKAIAPFVYGIALLVNYVVPFVGQTSHGATRWINIIGFEFQPSEILKFALILMLATYISNNYSRIKTIRYGFLPIFIMTILCCGATLLQRHLSATIIIFALGFVMLWLSGTKRLYVGAALGAAAVIAVAFATIGMEILEEKMPHVLVRFKIWENPFEYMSYESGGEGWQPAQSLYAISSGGFWGLGLGQSNQKHGFLPEPQNDYIFAILCEELGFFGVIAVMVLFCLLAYRGFHIAQKATTRFSTLLAMGLTTQIVIQTLLNLGVVSNTLPSTGISLPFFSYGGSSLILLLVQMGMVLSISRFSCVEQG